MCFLLSGNLAALRFSRSIICASLLACLRHRSASLPSPLACAARLAVAWSWSVTLSRMLMVLAIFLTPMFGLPWPFMCCFWRSSHPIASAIPRSMQFAMTRHSHVVSHFLAAVLKCVMFALKCLSIHL